MILGVDPGIAHTGWALVEGGQIVDRGHIGTGRDRSATGDIQRRLAEIGAVLHPLVFRARLVVIEWPSAGGFRTSGGEQHAAHAAQTNLAAGMVAGLAWGAGRKVRAPSPVTWRSALGHKRGRDEQLHADLAARFIFQLTDLRRGDLPHVLDAIGLALYGEQVTTRRASRQLALVPQEAPT